MVSARLFRLAGLVWLGLLLACREAAPPTASPLPVSTKPAPTGIPTELPQATSDPATATPLLQITLITPTPVPTQPPLPTAAPTDVISPTNGANPQGGPTDVPRPSGIGNTAADAALIGILQRCWHVSDTRQLNGNNADHRNAFECARQLLLGLAKNNPQYALVHRVLAWGYFYKDNEPGKALSEYRVAANLYKGQGDKVGESEARVRLALLLTSSSTPQACNELALAGSLDPTNDRASTYYKAFNCGNLAKQSGGAPPPPEPVVNLAALRGKILFKSDRGGFPATYVMDADGKNVQEVSLATYEAAAQWEAWSPDRSQAATVRPAGFTRKFGFDNDIWITDPQGNGRPLANPADDYDPAWSPVTLFDGRTWIAFVSNRGDLSHPDNQGEDLWLMHDDGTGPLRITCHAPFNTKHPSWSGDARKLVFHSLFQGNHAQIFVIDLSPLGTLQDNCRLADNPLNLSQNNYNDSDPIWVK